MGIHFQQISESCDMYLYFLLCLPLALAQNDVHGSAYLALPASEKLRLIWENVIADSTPGSWPGLELAEIFFEDMCVTMWQEGDEMPKAWTGNYRQKYIHSLGNVATVELISTGDHPYTGIFEGAQYGVARLSMAAEPSADVLMTTPGMGLKFLRDGIDSANLVAMYGVDGQESWNFFKNDFTNHIAAAQDPALVLLGDKFATATPYIQYVGLSNWGEIGQDGQREDSAKFPFMLRFEPTGELTFDEAYHGDFQDDLASIPEGSVLYKVYGLDQPKALGGVETLIGDLVTTSPCLPSNWGDNHLFYRHQDMREDVENYFPEWADHLDYTDVFGSQTCSFHKKH